MCSLAGWSSARQPNPTQATTVGNKKIPEAPPERLFFNFFYFGETAYILTQSAVPKATTCFFFGLLQFFPSQRMY